MVKILVVDDEPDMLHTLSMILRREGHETQEALSGEQALSMLGKGAVELVLLDIMMPVMDGFSVCKKMQASPSMKNIPIVMVTAKGDLENVEKAFKCPSVKSYIAKPFENEVLIKTVEDVIKKKTDGKGQKKSAQALNREVYKEIYEGYPEGVAILDSNNVVLEINNSFEAMTGFSKKEVIGVQNLPELLKPEDDQGNRLLVSEGFKACFCDDPVSTATFNIVNKNGLRLKVMSTVFKTKSRITVIVLRNITER